MATGFSGRTCCVDRRGFLAGSVAAGNVPLSERGAQDKPTAIVSITAPDVRFGDLAVALLPRLA